MFYLKNKSAGFSISVDGYSAGPAQNIDNPMGEGLLQGINLPEPGYECSMYTPTEKAAHLLIKRKTV